MKPPIVVVRPEPGCWDTVEAARKLRLEALAAPLFAIEPVAWEAPDPARFDGILAGSANAFRHGGAQLDRLVALPVYAVGDRTADVARANGFEVAAVGAGGLQPLLEAIPAPRRLLRLAGAARVALAPPTGIELAERVVYRARPLTLDPAAARRAQAGAVVVLHSAEAARAVAAECARLAIPRETVALAALAPRIAAAAGDGWRAVGVAPEVTDAALLAMVQDMCQ